jgi:hypothetical protein
VSARLKERAHDVGAFISQNLIVADIECDPGTEPDGGICSPEEGMERVAGALSRPTAIDGKIVIAAAPTVAA